MTEAAPASRVQRRDATVIFADITGFTALSERLDPEQVFGIVVGCLDALSAVVEEHGGQVERFLGDCVMAVFGLDGEDLEQAAHTAVHAAVAVHERLDRYNEEKGLTPALSVHTGVNTGPLIYGTSEGPRGEEHSFMGSVVGLASRLKDVALPGTIYVGPATHRITRADFPYEAAQTLEVGHSDAVVVHAIRAGGSGSATDPAEPGDAPAVESEREAERRLATVLFADLAGVTELVSRLPAEQAYPLVMGCMDALVPIVHKHEGRVERYLGDCVMAVFGAPLAIEDAPRAAVNAAIEMRNRARAYSQAKKLVPSLELHIGINTGLMISGDPSGRTARDFAVMGDAVNVASRLKDLAPPGHIVVGPATERPSREAFRYRALEPLQLKGRQLKLTPYDLLSEKESLHRRPALGPRPVQSELVGRETELARLREAAGGLAEGRGGLAGIVGEAGLGKSRLLEEFLETPEVRDARILPARSISIGRNLSFHPFMDLLRAWAEIDAEDPEAEALQRLEAAIDAVLGPAGADVLPFAATLLGLHPGGEAAARLARMEGEALEKLLVRSMRVLLEAIAKERPLILVFEDLHWADLSSIELLDSLLRLAEEHPVLVVAAFRPGFADTSERIFESAGRRFPERVVRCDLAPLDAKQSRRLLDAFFRNGHLPSTIKSVIEQKGGGNPFFLEEVVRSLLDDGAVEYRDGALWATDRIHQVEVPGSIRDVLLFRVDRLDRRRKELLQVASVIGRRFEPELLAELLADPEQIEPDLEGLAEIQLIERDAGWSFKHALTQDVVYESILHARRRTLHGAVAEAMERVLDEAPGRTGRLAYHFSLGGDPARSEHYLFLAGDEAARSAASNEALHFFQQAAELYLQSHVEGGDPEKGARLQKNLAQAFFNRGRFIEAADSFSLALEALGEKVPHGTWDLATTGLRAFVAFLAQLYLPSRGRKPSASPRQIEVMQLLYSRARAQTTASPTRFVVDSLDALRRLRGVDPRSVETAGGWFASGVGIFSYGGLSFGISERLLRRAEQILNVDEPRERLLFRLWHYLHHLLEGSWEKLEPISPEDRAEHLRLGQIWEVTTYLGLETEWLVYQGRFADAEADMEELGKLEDLYAYELAQSNHQGIEAFLQLERRQLDRAFAAIEEYYTSHRENLMNILALSTMAKIESLRGLPEEAAKAMAGAEERVRSTGTVPPFHLGHYLQAKLRCGIAELEAGEPGSGRRALRRRVLRDARRATRVAGRVAWRRPEAYRLRGSAHWICGHKRAALRCWEHASAEAERLGMRPELARTWAEVATRAAGVSGLELRGSSTQECRARAEALFDELGLVAERERLAQSSSQPGGW